MKNNKTSIIVIVFVLILAGGFVFVLRGRTSSPDQAVLPATEDETISMEVVDDTAVPASSEATAAPTEEQLSATEVSVPTVKEGLVATDPATVQLASGELQLIEAFAFW